jgi:hypothetical protein
MNDVAKCNDSKRRNPGTLLVVASENWPAAVMVLRANDEILSTVGNAGNLRPERERREAGRLKRRLRRRSEGGPTPTRELPASKLGC